MVEEGRVEIGIRIPEGDQDLVEIIGGGASEIAHLLEGASDVRVRLGGRIGGGRNERDPGQRLQGCVVQLASDDLLLLLSLGCVLVLQCALKLMKTECCQPCQGKDECPSESGEDHSPE